MKAVSQPRSHRPKGFGMALAALMALLILPASALAANSLLIDLDWQSTPKGDTLVLTFDRAPVPSFEENYDVRAAEARLTFWTTECRVSQTLRRLTPRSGEVAQVVASPLLFGEETATQVVLHFKGLPDYQIQEVGQTLHVVFAPESLRGKGDAVSSLSAEDLATLQSLEGLVSLDPEPIRLAQNETIGFEENLPPLDEEPGRAETMELETEPMPEDDLPDMSAILGEVADVPEAEQDAFVPPVGDARLKYSEIFGEDTDLLDETVWNTRIDSLRFREAPLQDALRLIAARSGLNILFNTEDVQGEITTELKDVKLGAALEAILRVNDLAAVRQEGNIVRIVPRGEVYSETIELAVRTRPLNWVRAQTMAATLTRFVSSEGEIVASRDANAIVIKDSPSSMARLMDLIDRLDVPEKQVSIELMAIDLNVTMLREQGISWNLARPDVEAIEFANAVPFSSEDDLALNQVGDDHIQRLFQQFAGATGPLTGFQSIPPPSGFGNLPLKVDQVGVRAPITGDPALAWEFGTDISILGNRFALETLVEALEDQNVLSVLAQPKVTTLNNIQAEIKIVRRTPFFETIQQPGSNNVSTTVRFEDIGLTVLATPNITNNNFVRMELETEQKIFVDIDRAATGATGITTDQRNFTSNVVVEDENTIVLGGLRSMNTTNNERGVPWFRRAPVLGWLFKNQRREQDKKELMLFVTPRIIKNPRLTEFEKSRYDQLDMMWSLPDYFFDDARVVPEDFYQMF